MAHLFSNICSALRSDFDLIESRAKLRRHLALPDPRANSVPFIILAGQELLRAHPHRPLHWRDVALLDNTLSHVTHHLSTNIEAQSVLTLGTARLVRMARKIHTTDTQLQGALEHAFGEAVQHLCQADGNIAYAVARTIWQMRAKNPDYLNVRVAQIILPRQSHLAQPLRP